MGRMIMENSANAKINELSRYKKEDLLDAVSNCCTEFVISKMLSYLKIKKVNETFDNKTKAMEDYNAALRDYIAWKDEVIHKYGDGKSVQLSAIPLEDKLHGAELQSKMAVAQNKEAAASKAERLALRLLSSDKD